MGQARQKGRGWRWREERDTYNILAILGAALGADAVGSAGCVLLVGSVGTIGQSRGCDGEDGEDGCELHDCFERFVAGF